jgi:hypothetical protein
MSVLGEEWAKDGSFSSTRRLRIIDDIDQSGDSQSVGEEDEL